MTNWKAIAITLMIILAVIIAWGWWGVSLVLEEEEKINECYYEICEYYPEASYEDEFCYCYELNEDTWEYDIVKTKWMK